MSKAEELLNSLDSSNNVVILSADASSEPHIVIDSKRFITVPDELKRIAVQYDHNIETVTFDCPRYWDEHDMSQWVVCINYARSDKNIGVYKATNLIADSEDSTVMHFDWTISRDVTYTSGQITFNVCIKQVDNSGNEVYHWNTELCQDCYVSKGLETNITVDNA